MRGLALCLSLENARVFDLEVFLVFVFAWRDAISFSFLLSSVSIDKVGRVNFKIIPCVT